MFLDINASDGTCISLEIIALHILQIGKDEKQRFLATFQV
jgi:hypothetical protein